MDYERKYFAAADYVVFSLTVLLSISIGLYFAFAGKGQKTTLGYFLAGRNMKFAPVGMSLVVTFQSSIMLLGFPAEVYFHGFMISIFNIGQLVALLLATRIVVPLMFPLRITSVFHYLQMRFKTNSVRLLTVTIGILSQLTYMGVVLFGPALAMKSVSDFPIWASVLCVAVAAVVYTSIGGIQAVIWTDVFQCVVIIIGIIAMLIKGTIDSGGARNVMAINYETGRLNVLNFDPDPTIRHTTWTVLIGSFFGSFPLTLSQSTIQRFNSTPTQKEAKRVLYLAGPLFVTMQMMSMVVGLVCFAYYTTKRCDPYLSGQIHNPNQIVPFMIMDIFHAYQGLSGLFISALFGASLSTLSSILAGLSANTCEDFVKPYFDLSDRTLTLIAKVAVIVYGGLGVCVALMLDKVEGSLSQILFSIMGAVTGPSVGIFFLAMFFPRTTTKGVIIGGLIGLVFSFWIAFGFTFSKTLPRTPHLPLAPTDGCSLGPHVFPTNSTNSTNVHLYSQTTSPLLSLAPSTNASFESSTVDTFINVTVATQANAVVNPLVKGTAQGIDRLYSISYAYFSTLGMFITMVVGLMVSMVTSIRSGKPEVDNRYLLPLVDQLCCCFPERWKSACRCGIPEMDKIARGEYDDNHLEMDMTNDMDPQDNQAKLSENDK